MCLILFAWQVHPDYPLVLAANRDEFFARPTRPAHWWPDDMELLAGQDLSAGGTWMGVTRTGRFAALTNFREPVQAAHKHATTCSRGLLVTDFLRGNLDAENYLLSLNQRAADFQGYNLICGELGKGLWYASNRSLGVQEITPGLHGLSNHLLDTPWPKVQTGKQALARQLKVAITPPALFQILQNPHTYPEDELPHTGVSREWERVLSAACIRAPERHYGTRSSTVVLYRKDGHVDFMECSYSSPETNAEILNVTGEQSYRFSI